MGGMRHSAKLRGRILPKAGLNFQLALRTPAS